jgi:hypothetical protein
MAQWLPLQVKDFGQFHARYGAGTDCHGTHLVLADAGYDDDIRDAILVSQRLWLQTVR